MSEKSGHYLEQNGLFYYPSSKGDGHEDDQRPIWLCAPMSVTALAKDEEGCWFKVIEFLDLDGKKLKHLIEYRLLARKDELWQTLLETGLQIAGASNARNLLHTFLNGEQPEPRAFIISRLGWYEDNGICTFVFPEGAIGETATEIIYRGNHNPYEI